MQIVKQEERGALRSKRVIKTPQIKQSFLEAIKQSSTDRGLGLVQTSTWLEWILHGLSVWQTLLDAVSGSGSYYAIHTPPVFRITLPPPEAHRWEISYSLSHVLRGASNEVCDWRISAGSIVEQYAVLSACANVPFTEKQTRKSKIPPNVTPIPPNPTPFHLIVSRPPFIHSPVPVALPSHSVSALHHRRHSSLHCCFTVDLDFSHSLLLSFRPLHFVQTHTCSSSFATNQKQKKSLLFRLFSTQHKEIFPSGM